MTEEQRTYPKSALDKFRQWHFWWLVVFSFLLIVIFVYYLPTIGLAQNSGNGPPPPAGQVSGMKTIFEITDSEYLNITLKSSIPIEAAIQSAPKVVSVVIQSNAVSPLQLTFFGFVPNKTYYRYDNSFKNETIFNTDGAGSFSFIQDLSQGHHIWIQETHGTFFIPADCNSSIGMFNQTTNTCTLNQDLSANIEITDNGITLDCNNHKLSDGFRWTSFAILLNNRQNVTVKNCTIENATNAINATFSDNNTFINNSATGNHTSFRLISSNNNTVSGNTSSTNGQGVALGSVGFPISSRNNIITDNVISDILFGITVNLSQSNRIERNTITGHSSTGVHITGLANTNILSENVIAQNAFGVFVLQSDGTTLVDNNIRDNQNGVTIGVLSFDTKVFHNNFINNTTQAQAFTASSFDNGLPDGGNYWNNYDTPAEGCNNLNNDNFCDAPFVFTGGQDNFPWTKRDGWKGPPILPVINFLQNDSRWATILYDFTPNNIKELGCALTSAAMVLQFHGITTTPDTLEATNPQTLNRWLNDHKGYELLPSGRRGNLDFTKLPKYSKDKVNYLGGRDIGRGFTESQIKQTIDFDLASGSPVIVKTEYQNIVTTATTSHYVVIKGKIGNTYAINDPLSTTTKTLADRNYPILGVRRVAKSDGIPTPRLTITGASPLQLFITDPSNRRSGFDSTIQQVVFNIPSSSYYEDRIDDDTGGNAQAGPVKVLDVISPENGQYVLEVVGEGLGTYTITIDAADDQGVFREVSIAGITDTGIISSFVVDFSSTFDTAPTITRKATIPSTRDDILNAFKLGLIDNQGIVNSLIKKLDNVELKLQHNNIKVARNILNALKNEIKAQRGKHITKDITGILLEDINSVGQSITQNTANKPLRLLANFLSTFSQKLFNIFSKFVSYILSSLKQEPTLIHEARPTETPFSTSTPTTKESPIFLNNDNLWMVDENGSKERQLTHGGRVVDFFWLPDSNSIVFDQFTGSGGMVYVEVKILNIEDGTETLIDKMKADFSDVAHLDPHFEFNLIISPDKKKLLYGGSLLNFVEDIKRSGNNRVIMYDIETKRKKQIPLFDGDRKIIFSPGSNLLVGFYNWNLYTISLGNFLQTQLTYFDPKVFEKEYKYFEYPHDVIAWPLGNSKIIYYFGNLGQGLASTEATYHLYHIDANSLVAQKLTNSGLGDREFFLGLSSDGREIYYGVTRYRRSGDIYETYYTEFMKANIKTGEIKPMDASERARFGK